MAISARYIYMHYSFQIATIKAKIILEILSMQIEENYHLEFQSAKTIILQIQPAFNRTFVLLTVDRPGFGEIIIHVDANGKELFRHVAKDTINFMAMLNDRTVAQSFIEDSKVVLINLEKWTVGGINHKFMSDCTAAVNIEFFLETNLLVLIEKGEAHEHLLRLTYLGDNEDDGPVSQYTTNEGQFKHNYQVVKGNAHSMVIWTNICHKNSIILWVYDLRDPLPFGVQRKPRQILITNKVPFENPNVLLSIANVWESKPNYFFLACNSNLEKKDPNRANNTNLVYDVMTDILCESKFSFKGLDNEFLMDRQPFGDYSVFPTFNFDNNKPVESEVYIVNHVIQELAGIKWFPSWTHRWFPVSHEYNSILLAKYGHDAMNVDIKLIKMLSPLAASLEKQPNSSFTTSE